MSKASDPTVVDFEKERGQASDAFDAASFEQNNVHAVYEAIASHFSDTRYKPWPLIPAFLHSVPRGSIGADVGCGNGKYLAVDSILNHNTQEESAEGRGDRRILTVGVDRSSNLIDLAATNFIASCTANVNGKHEVAVGDAIHSGYRTGCFDYAFSIATIHHFATIERRIQAVEEMIRIVRPVDTKEQSSLPGSGLAEPNSSSYTGLASGAGRFLIVVWALEQRGQSRRRFEDVNADKEDAATADTAEQSKNSAGQDLMVPWILRKGPATESEGKPAAKHTLSQTGSNVYQRFYHVFEQGELEDLVVKASQKFPHITVRQEIGGWEKGNWYGVWQCVRR